MEGITTARTAEIAGRIAAAALFVGLCSLPVAGGAQEPASTADAAFADDPARELVARVRARRSLQRIEIGAYRALVRERMSAHLDLPFRDRLVYRREMAARIRWTRDGPSTLEVLGARELRPSLETEIRVLEGVAEEALDLTFEPQSYGSHIGLAGFRFGRHPLEADAAPRYRFRSGDTTRVGLPDGRVLRLAELRVEPLRRHSDLAVGSIWVDLDSDLVVRESFRRVGGEGDWALGERRGVTRIPLVGEMTMEVQGVSVEYALWEMRWWMPASLVFDVAVRGGRIATVLLRYERAYSEYEVAELEGEPASPAPPEGAPSTRWTVELPEDRGRLLRSPELAPSIFEPVPAGFDQERLAALRRRFAEIHEPPEIESPTLFRWEAGTLDLVHFNRVEGLAPGLRLSLEGGAGGAEVELRVGTEGGEPHGALRLVPRGSRSVRLSAFRDLRTVATPFPVESVAGPLDALVAGWDPWNYYRSAGVALDGTSRPGFRWRLFAERQESVRKRTDWSLAHLVDGTRGFRENPPVDGAELLGVSLAAETGGGAPGHTGWGAGFSALAAVGSFDHMRLEGRSHLLVPLAGGLRVGLAAAGGGSVGRPPLQAGWIVGGIGGVRGYAVDRSFGEAFWVGRGELSAGSLALRGSLFADAGWAGDPEAHRWDDALASVGVGLSVLDGVLRVDLARALRSPAGWRVEVSGSAPF